MEVLLFLHFFLFRSNQELNRRHHIGICLNSFPQILLIWPLLLSESSSMALKCNFHPCHWIFCIALKLIVPQTSPPALFASVHMHHPVTVQLKSSQLLFWPFCLALCVLHYFMAQLPFVTGLLTYFCSQWACSLITVILGSYQILLNIHLKE